MFSWKSYVSSIILFCITTIVSLSNATALQVPAFTARVIDLTNTLSNKQQQQLEQYLIKLEQQASNGNQIAILMIPSLEDESLEGYAVKVFEQWKLGKAKIDNGVLILVAKNDRLVRIEVGYGLESSVTDLMSKRIINNMLPYFQQNDFANGLTLAIEQLWLLIEKGDIPFGTDTEKEDPESLLFNFLSLGFALLIIFNCLKLVAFVIPISAILYFIAISSLGLEHNFATMLVSMLVSFASYCLFFGFPKADLKNLNSSGHGRHGRGGGFGGGGFGGGGFGGGGFGGGGGRSGGGGASGRW